MPDLQAPSVSLPPDVGVFRNWKPEAQQRALEVIERRESRPWRPFYCRRPKCNGQPHITPSKKTECPAMFGHEWVPAGDGWVCTQCSVPGGKVIDNWLWRHARHDQHPPRWHQDWLTWFLSGGRGSGKTRSGSEVTHRATDIYGYLIFIAPTGPDFRDTMVEGESGLLATAHPDNIPEYEPSKKKLTWPNGAIGLGFSAEEPDRLRGKQSGYVWADEPAHYPDPEDVWSNMEFGHRLEGKKGAQPKVVMTSTPKPTKFVKDKIAEDGTIVVRASSYANASNLAESWKKRVLGKHEGTRLGRQEIGGEILEDVEGALWKWDMYRRVKPADLPAMRRVIVAVDPAGTANARSDETGIIILGVDYQGVIYVIDDWTGRYSPGAWGNRVHSGHDAFSADAVVVEKTYGRDMVQHVLETTRAAGAPMPRIIDVDSRRGKAIRAEPVVALYEKQSPLDDRGNKRPQLPPPRILHVIERCAKVEDEQTSWVPGEGASPNRVDALVHGVRELDNGENNEAEIASPLSLQDGTPMMSETESGLLIPSGFSVHSPDDSYGSILDGGPYGGYPF